MLNEATEDSDGASAHQTSVIAAFIKRFREAPPTAPDHRPLPKDKEAFWWVSKGLVRREEEALQRAADSAGGCTPEERDSGDEHTSALDTSEGEIPREAVPVRAEESARAAAPPPPPRSPEPEPAAPAPSLASSSSRPDWADEAGDLQPSPSECADFAISAEKIPPSPHSFLDSEKKFDEKFEFDFGMEELDARTDLLLQRCEQVLSNFKAKPASPGREQVSAPPPPPAPAAAVSPSRQRLGSPVRGLRTGDESIFSLTSVLSDDEEASCEAGEAGPDAETADADPTAAAGRQDAAGDPAGGQGGQGEDGAADHPPPLKPGTAQTPPRSRPAGRHGRRHPQGSPESVRSINGISADNSGLFMFLSSSDEGNGHPSSSRGAEAQNSLPPLTNDSELSHSTASYSEEYHRIMNSLEYIGEFEGRDRSPHAGPKGADHPHTLMRASKDYFNKHKAEFRVPTVLTPDTISPFLDDEIVNVLWRRLVTVRSELRRRADEDKT